MQWFGKLKLQGKIIVLVCSVVVISLSATGWVFSRQVEAETKAQLGHAIMSVGRIMAKSAIVVEGLKGNRPMDDIQEYARSLRELTNHSIIVVFDMDGLRKAHPNPAMIGKRVVGGDEWDSLQGKEYLSTAVGTLGPQIRAFVPVYSDGKQIGVVLVGMTLNEVDAAVAESRKGVLMTTLLGLVIGITGAGVLAGAIKKTLFGLEPDEIAKMLEERSAMLYSVREGVMAVDQTGRLTIINDAAMKMLRNAGLEGELIGQPVDEVIPNTGLARVLKTGEAELNREQQLSGIRILTNRVPEVVDGRIRGAVATFRDKTEIGQLAEELTGVSAYVEALRSQGHDFTERLRVILEMVERGRYFQLTEYVQRILAAQESEVDMVGRYIKDPIIAGLVLSKLSHARELAVKVTIAKESLLSEQFNQALQHEMVTVIGNLLDNALEAVASTALKEVCLAINEDTEKISIRVDDSGCELSPEVVQRITEKGFLNENNDRGYSLYLASNSLKRLGGYLEFRGNERGMSLTAIIPLKQ